VVLQEQALLEQVLELLLLLLLMRLLLLRLQRITNNHLQSQVLVLQQLLPRHPLLEQGVVLALVRLQPLMVHLSILRRAMPALPSRMQNQLLLAAHAHWLRHRRTTTSRALIATSTTWLLPPNTTPSRYQHGTLHRLLLTGQQRRQHSLAQGWKLHAHQLLLLLLALLPGLLLLHSHLGLSPSLQGQPKRARLAAQQHPQHTQQPPHRHPRHHHPHTSLTCSLAMPHSLAPLPPQWC
jgi:hypothetical protein